MGVKGRVAQAVGSTVNALKKEATGGSVETPPRGRVDQTTLDAVIASWAEAPRNVVETVIAKYGLPNEATESRLIWYETGPFKRTVVYRDEIPHNFPSPHTDLLEQYIDYRVPIEKVDDLAAFDGSIVVDRTRGEVSARCDKQAMNYLALNLMHEIVVGHMDVKKARRTYAENAVGYVMSRPAPYTERLLFQPARGGTADSDEVQIGDAMLQQMKEKVRDATR
jgi:hypothetical protein